jgi:hypothetical protein
MAKSTGLGWTAFSVDDAGGVARDIRTDVNSLDFSTPYDTEDITGLDKYAIERQALLADFKGTFKFTFDPAANYVHSVLSGDLRVARTMSITVATKSLPNEVLLTEYSLTRDSSGSLNGSCPFVLSDGTTPTWS